MCLATSSNPLFSLNIYLIFTFLFWFTVCSYIFLHIFILYFTNYHISKFLIGTLSFKIILHLNKHSTHLNLC